MKSTLSVLVLAALSLCTVVVAGAYAQTDDAASVAPATAVDAVLDGHAEDVAQDVKQGDTTLVEATRDPEKSGDPVTPGYWLCVLVAGALVRYGMDHWVRGRRGIDNKKAGIIANTATAVVTATLVALLHKVSPKLPQDIQAIIATGAVSVSGATFLMTLLRALGLEPSSRGGAS